MKKIFCLFLSIFLFTNVFYGQGEDYLRQFYSKKEVYIPMRDRIKLFTAIYSPRDSSKTYPILFCKTPYGITPYGADSFPSDIGPSAYLAKEKYIIVYQDARGMFMSEGIMDQMTPHLHSKPDSTYIDNSTDTYDAIEWLMHNTNNNGKAGLWGISYRGFYVSSGIIDAHPAIVCASPQAPIADWFAGDDVHHNGAFCLLPNFDFLEVVGQEQPEYTKKWPNTFDFPMKDAYNFFLHIGRLSEVNSRYFESKVPFWDTLMAHPNYDKFWKERNITPHLSNIRPAVMVTGGLFDHENLYGSLQTYKSIKRTSVEKPRIILGPWIHGGWARTTGESLGGIDFGSATSDFYQKEIELPFFNYYLKQKGNIESMPRVYAFSTGNNSWNTFNEWPPKPTKVKHIYFSENGALTNVAPENSGFDFDSYESDPAKPVPYTRVFHPVRLFYDHEYMIEDQRFASARPDVMGYQSGPLADTILVAGPIEAKLFVASSGTDFDLVVKIIDVYPDTINSDYYQVTITEMAGFQQLVRAEIMRVKYRSSFENPEPIIPGTIEPVNVNLNDICHAFLPGHRIMIQIQSSWFPLYDRNPQKFMNIYKAGNNDFQKATIQIYHSKEYPSCITFNRL